MQIVVLYKTTGYRKTDKKKRQSLSEFMMMNTTFSTSIKQTNKKNENLYKPPTNEREIESQKKNTNNRNIDESRERERKNVIKRND